MEREYTCRSCGIAWVAESRPGRPPGYCTRSCREQAARKRATAWYRANPERVVQHQSRQAGRRSTYWSSYYEANRERMIERSTQYARDNPDAKRARDSARYARTRGAPTAEYFTLDEIYERDGAVCHLCDGPAPRDRATIDHVIPVALGGPHTRANVALACWSCNSSRKTMPVEEFRRRRLTTNLEAS